MRLHMMTAEEFTRCHSGIQSSNISKDGVFIIDATEGHDLLEESMFAGLQLPFVILVNNPLGVDQMTKAGCVAYGLSSRKDCLIRTGEYETIDGVTIYEYVCPEEPEEAEGGNE